MTMTLRMRRKLHHFLVRIGARKADPKTLGYGTLKLSSTELNPDNVALAFRGAPPYNGGPVGVAPGEVPAVLTPGYDVPAFTTKVPALLEPASMESVVISQPVPMPDVPGPDPRNIARMILQFAGHRDVPSVAKANLRVEAMMLMRWCDLAFGRVAGEVRLELTPDEIKASIAARLPAKVWVVYNPRVCDECDGRGEVLEAYSNHNGSHCERDITCPACHGETILDGWPA